MSSSSHPSLSASEDLSRLPLGERDTLIGVSKETRERLQGYRTMLTELLEVQMSDERRADIVREIRPYFLRLGRTRASGVILSLEEERGLQNGEVSEKLVREFLKYFEAFDLSESA